MTNTQPFTARFPALKHGENIAICSEYLRIAPDVFHPPYISIGLLFLFSTLQHPPTSVLSLGLQDEAQPVGEFNGMVAVRVQYEPEEEVRSVAVEDSFARVPYRHTQQ